MTRLGAALALAVLSGGCGRAPPPAPPEVDASWELVPGGALLRARTGPGAVLRVAGRQEAADGQGRAAFLFMDEELGPEPVLEIAVLGGAARGLELPEALRTPEARLWPPLPGRHRVTKGGGEAAPLLVDDAAASLLLRLRLPPFSTARVDDAEAAPRDAGSEAVLRLPILTVAADVPLAAFLRHPYAATPPGFAPVEVRRTLALTRRGVEAEEALRLTLDPSDPALVHAAREALREAEGPLHFGGGAAAPPEEGSGEARLLAPALRVQVGPPGALRDLTYLATRTRGAERPGGPCPGAGGTRTLVDEDWEVRALATGAVRWRRTFPAAPRPCLSDAVQGPDPALVERWLRSLLRDSDGDGARGPTPPPGAGP